MIRALLLVVLATSTAAAEEPTVVESKIHSIGLFKNGFAVVRRDISIPSSGRYSVLDVPVPVHGTFWIESTTRVDTRVTRRRVEVEERRRPGADLQTALAGRMVTITLHGDLSLGLRGRVVDFPTHEPGFDRNYAAPNPWGVPGHVNVGAAAPSRFLVLDTAQGEVYLDRGQIKKLEVDRGGGKKTVERPVLVFEAADVPTGGATVRVSYLTKGVAWAPSYRLNLGEKTMTIEQQATIRNELSDLHHVEVELISGFPSIQFGHVVSPMAATTNWTQFFGQISQRSQNATGLAGNVMSQAVAYNNAAPGAFGGGGIVPSVEGVDAHYQSVGARSLNRGDSLVLSVAQERTTYERIVEWIVPDNRDENGRYDQNRQFQSGSPRDSAWDAVQFSNPFEFPMTTGPACVISEDRFRGQRMSQWVNVGQKTTLPITRALSIRTLSSEQEEPETREHRRIGGHNYRQVSVKGELLICNHRSETVKMIVRRQFSGQLLEADESPSERLLEEGAHSVNQRNELSWVLEIAPGEERTVSYRYDVLVYR